MGLRSRALPLFSATGSDHRLDASEIKIAYEKSPALPLQLVVPVFNGDTCKFTSCEDIESGSVRLQ